MAASKSNPGGRSRESLRGALAQVALVAGVLAALVAWQVHRGTVRREVSTRYQAARALAQRDNPAELRQAVDELRALLALDAETPDAQALAADVNARLWLDHQQPEAEGAAREHLARAEALQSRSGERYATQALVLLADGKAAAAQSFLEELERQGARGPKLSLVRARVLLARGQLAEARQHLSQAREEAWREPRYAVAHGEALLDEGLSAQAAEVLKKATAVSPEHLRARLSLTLARLYQGLDGREAPPALEEDVLQHPETLSPALRARALTVRAARALAAGRPDAALADADAALAASPEELHARVLKARVLALGKDAQARAAFTQAVERRRTAPLAYFDGARALREAGDGEGALALLDAYAGTFRDVRVASGRPGATVGALERDDRYWLARGQVLEALAQGDAALGAYDKALEARGLNQARAQYAKAALLLARGETATAQTLLAELAPDNGQGSLPEAYESLGQLHFARGEYAQACQQHYLGLSRARLQGSPPEGLRLKAAALEKRLTDAGQPAMARTWTQETQTLLR